MENTVKLPTFNSMVLYVDRTIRGYTPYITVAKLYPIDIATYNKIVVNEVTRQALRSETNRDKRMKIETTKYTIADLEFDHADIIVCSRIDYENEQPLLKAYSTIQNIFGEFPEKWIESNYNPEKNECIKKEDNKIGITQCFDPHRLMRYNIGRIGNPSHFIVIKTKLYKQRSPENE